MTEIRVGQVYASTHPSDREKGVRQRRRVVNVVRYGQPPHVVLQTEGSKRAVPGSRVTLRSSRSHTIPGHRLVEDVIA